MALDPFKPSDKAGVREFRPRHDHDGTRSHKPHGVRSSPQGDPAGPGRAIPANTNPPAEDQPLDLGNYSSGRGTMVVALEALRGLRHLGVGDPVSIPILEGLLIEGTVTMARTDGKGDTWVRSVALNEDPDAVLLVDHPGPGRLSGHLYSPKSPTALLIKGIDEGQVVFKELPRTSLIPECTMIADGAAVATPPPSGVGVSSPSLESLPEADKVLYLDFDGEFVANTVWNANFNGGNALDVDPSGVSASEIEEIWMAVSEDFRPFSVNVTTDRAVYDATASTKRMMVVFTPTYEWYGSAGGVAYLRSFGDQSYGVCWVFTSLVGGGPHNRAMAASHELGHTLSLRHDGDTTRGLSYHGGLGSGETSWGTIMGAPYYRNLVQWNPGDYPGADNLEDDVSIIEGYLGRQNDDAADSPAGATPLRRGPDGTSAEHPGLISHQDDVDLFELQLESGSVNLVARSLGSSTTSTEGANLDIRLRLLDPAGTELEFDSPNDGIDAAINHSVPAGTYYLEVSGAGRSGPDGYSDYGSLGSYLVSGTAPWASGDTGTIEVLGNGIVISHGDPSPEPSDGTRIETGSSSRFTVRNPGAAAVTVTSISSTIGAFTVGAPDLPWPIQPGEERDFTVAYQATGNGAAAAVISVDHSGSGPAPYQFLVEGSGGCRRR